MQGPMYVNQVVAGTRVVWSRLFQKRDTEPRVKREEVIVYGGVNRAKAWRAMVPVADLWRNLDPTARRAPAGDNTRSMMGTIGAVMASLVLFGLFYTMAPTLSALVLGGVIGGPVGGVAGWLIGAKIEPRAYWLVRPVEGGGYEAITQEETMKIISTEEIPKQFYSAFGEEAGAGMTAYGIPTIASAGFLYEAERMTDEVEDMRSGRDTWQKIEVGALVTIAVALVGVLFLFGVVIQQE